VPIVFRFVLQKLFTHVKQVVQSGPCKNDSPQHSQIQKHVETAGEARASEAHGMEMTSLAPEKFSGGGQIDNHRKPKNLNIFRIRKRSSLLNAKSNVSWEIVSLLLD